MDPLLTIHFAATWALIGLIWTVQLVHYPLFAQVGAETFRGYHARHTLRVTLVVAPLMGLEALTCGLLILHGAREWWLLASVVPLVFNWLATWRVQVPLHARLARGFDPGAHRRLVAGNRWRTAAWSLRGGCLLCGISWRASGV